ncbi:hypothetical protein PIB30_035530 [Stylosanthes scabra]|uniref:PB1-like domain-containing protein n=1 Tax=Stylosanthes scabra TaxID=79078 RepID=A0ABU6QDT5_9FABA|nr:hypothetical protein [Stylosanthes scabra]
MLLSVLWYNPNFRLGCWEDSVSTKTQEKRHVNNFLSHSSTKNQINTPIDDDRESSSPPSVSRDHHFELRRSFRAESRGSWSGSFVTKDNDNVAYEEDNIEELDQLDEDTLDVFAVRDHHHALGYPKIDPYPKLQTTKQK